MKKFLLLLLVSFFLITESNATILENVIIKGNNRISDETIKSIIDFKKNKNYTIDEINNFQKKLFKTNFFKVLDLKIDNKNLLINLEENPVIDFFYIKGAINKKREDELYNNLSLGQSKIYSEYLLLKDINKIKSIYQSAGYFEAEVNPEISIMEGNSLNLIYNIDRKKKFKINRIFFIGQKYFSSSELLNVVSSEESGWWKFFSNKSIPSTERIDYDIFLLKNFYQNQGFYNAQILSNEITKNTDKSVNLTFSINSGPKFYFSNYNIVDESFEISDQNKFEIEQIIKNNISSSYSKNKITNLNKQIYNFLNTNKIEFVNFKITENVVSENKIDINVFFSKGTKKFVNDIIIKGNRLTNENVVRRELEFSEGDSFENYKIEKSVNNIKNLGIFKDVSLQYDTNSSIEEIDLTIEVEEQPTGSISAGFGVGSAGAALSTNLNERNLFGTGTKADINLSAGSEKLTGSVNIVIPDFKNTDNDLGFNIFAINTEYENTGYDSKKIGIDLSTQYQIFEDIYFNPGIGLNLDDITVKSTASELYKSRAGDYITFRNFYSIISDNRDKIFKTTKGSRKIFKQALTLPPSDVLTIENDLSSSSYYSLTKDYILNYKIGFNLTNSIDDNNIKLSDRNFLSNRKLRGFESFGVGPFDGGEHIGGNYTAYASISSTIPNPLPEKWNANSILFLDTGNVWGVDFDSSKDSDKIRSSFGIGLEWISPLGPLNFTLSEVLTSASTDKEESFSFQIGSTF